MKKLAIIILFLCQSTSFAGSSSDGRARAQSLFISANNYYREGAIKEAIKDYESILALGYENGAVHYNLGNSYFKDGQLGLAILHYERAKGYIPRDGDLLFNRQYAMQRIAKSSKSDSRNFFLKQMEGHSSFYTKGELIGVICISLIVVGLIFNLSLFLHWPSSLRNGVIIVGTFVLIIYTAGLLFKVSSHTGEAVVIKKGDAKFEPRKEGTNHFRLPEGVVVKILKEEDGWAKIKRDDAKLGWVEIEHIEEI